MNKKTAFSGITPDAAAHFRLSVLGTVLHMANLYDSGDADHFAFIADYQNECARLLAISKIPAAKDWQAKLIEWAGEGTYLPLNRLSHAGLDPLSLQLLLSIAAVDEDAQLAYIVEADGSRPTIGGLIALWRRASTPDNAAEIRNHLLDMIALNLIEVINPDASRSEWALRVPAVILDIISGTQPRIPSALFEYSQNLPDPKSWIIAKKEAVSPEKLGTILAQSDRQLLLIRGPKHNGRKTLVRMAAKVAGKNCLSVGSDVINDPVRWALYCRTAWLCNALLLIEVELTPGETLRLPNCGTMSGPIAIVAGSHGAVEMPDNWPIMRTNLPIAPANIRKSHWRAAGLAMLADPLKNKILTSGTIYRTSQSARNAAINQEDKSITIDMVESSIRTLRDARLDALATPIGNLARRDPLVLPERWQTEFDTILMRCQRREEVDSLNGNIGVRALFSGPSGTGKSLAAMHVAAILGKDLYRIDLSATVNKYIGETEKALERTLAAAEELDIVLLLDEGDALMTKRTDVSNANDRYANLETNFLLQRIENFTGIILITTNDSARIDSAFARRMDAVLNFSAPDAGTRHKILTKLLGNHGVSEAFLLDVAARCDLNGGQLKNIVLHAQLLAKNNAKRRVSDVELRAAIIREYQKSDAIPPLKAARPELAIAS